MRRVSIVGFMFLLLIGTAVTIAAAGEEPRAAENGQSMAAAAEVEHDHGSTCGSGGSCCSACQTRQKYAKADADGEAGGCPCQRARRAREQAAREQAAREQTGPAAD